MPHGYTDQLAWNNSLIEGGNDGTEFRRNGQPVPTKPTFEEDGSSGFTLKFRANSTSDRIPTPTFSSGTLSACAPCPHSSDKAQTTTSLPVASTTAFGSGHAKTFGVVSSSTTDPCCSPNHLTHFSLSHSNTSSISGYAPSGSTQARGRLQF